jgi:hypothetical protein
MIITRTPDIEQALAEEARKRGTLIITVEDEEHLEDFKAYMP